VEVGRGPLTASLDLRAAVVVGLLFLPVGLVVWVAESAWQECRDVASAIPPSRPFGTVPDETSP
jgi:hypothetical protein